MTDVYAGIPSADDVGYEFRREQLLEEAEAPLAPLPSRVREIGRLEDDQGRIVIVGIDGGTVTLGLGGGGVVTLGPAKSEEFAQLYNAACWLAAAQWALEAAADGTCPGGCGAQHHDQACRPT